ncbi:hypothetical protein Rsub_09362 [Raphidocelis subcapitata]|uniref:Uncharacterized protein n=1 Tax=Raphidocelis subcapitata TaxID=307507 RepID=A0A2V0P9U6_9CHLO|nr:hypothetical protein Rsub_09362 [Raphidocelis subcapitata]|eukprot:GBF96616.1 hypothetical protein Rsub_09362 [Raphidocelis subcapitata]
MLPSPDACAAAAAAAEAACGLHQGALAPAAGFGPEPRLTPLGLAARLFLCFALAAVVSLLLPAASNALAARLVCAARGLRVPPGGARRRRRGRGRGAGAGAGVGGAAAEGPPVRLVRLTSGEAFFYMLLCSALDASRRAASALGLGARAPPRRRGSDGGAACLSRRGSRGSGDGAGPRGPPLPPPPALLY